MPEHMRNETVEIIMTACEKFGTSYYVRLFIIPYAKRRIPILPIFERTPGSRIPP